MANMCFFIFSPEGVPRCVPGLTTRRDVLRWTGTEYLDAKTA